MDTIAITAAVQAGQITHKQGIDLYNTLVAGRSPDVASSLHLPCEECGRVVVFANMVSYKVWVPMPGHAAVRGYDEHDQHFCCSHDCAEKSVANCVAGHLRPEAERRCSQAVQAAQQAQQALDG